MTVSNYLRKWINLSARCFCFVLVLFLLFVLFLCTFCCLFFVFPSLFLFLFFIDLLPCVITSYI